MNLERDEATLRNMVRQRKVKAARREARRSEGELDEKLKEQFSLLKVQAQTYDEGKHIIALSGATTLRVMLHQTSNSHALLQLMGLLTSLCFMDTAQQIEPRNLLSTPGLVHMKIETGKGATFEAPLNNLSPPRLRQPLLPFQPWWSTPIMKGPTGATWCRKDLVLYQTNKQGGAHIDPNISDMELRQVEEDAFGFRFTDMSGTTKFLNGPLLPSIRQIMFEVLSTLEPIVS